MASDEESKTPVRFANEIEEAFSRLLDLLQIRWEYEPRTFVLDMKTDQKIKMGFAPDFYLPDLDLYIELSAAQDNNRKSKKLRTLREKFPGINAVVLYRKDLKLMLHAPDGS